MTVQPGDGSAPTSPGSSRTRPRRGRPPGSRGHHPLLRIWIPSSALLFCLFAMWSLATPIGAASDEPAQLVKAVSVAHGQILGPAVTPTSIRRLDRTGRGEIAYCAIRAGNKCFRAQTLVTVPHDFGDYTGVSCDTKVTVPAGCGEGLDNRTADIVASTYVGRYPPLYYAVVGLPSLALHGDAAVYLMRLVSDLLSALFVGLAFGLATRYSRSPLLPAALGVACTPMVMVFSSTVNPSGLEMAAAACVWCGGLALVLEHADRPPAGLVASTGAAAAVMVLVRGLSPFWLLVIAVSLAALAPRALAALARHRSVRLAAAGVAVVAVVAVAYVVGAHALDVAPGPGLPIARGTPLLHVVEQALGRTGVFYRQAVGAFGWQETSPPLLVLGTWTAVGSLVVILGMVSGSRRRVAVLVALVVASLVVPLVLMVSQYSSVQGLVWQARDGYPLYGGVLLVAGAIAFGGGPASPLGRRPDGSPPAWFRRLVPVIAIGITTVQLGDVLWALRRYTVGLGTTVDPFARVPGGWSPPTGTATVVVVSAAAAVAYGWWVVHLTRVQGGTRRSADPPASGLPAPDVGAVAGVGVGDPGGWPG